jgi:hypothetical protein
VFSFFLSFYLKAIKKLFDMIVSILHNIAQVPELVNDLRRYQVLEVCAEEHDELVSMEMIHSDSRF